MSTELHQLSEAELAEIPDASRFRFAIVVSEWNRDITDNLKESAYSTLIKYGADPKNITVEYVPGSFELIYASRRIAQVIRPHAVIALGCVIRGETPHFEYVCSGVTQGFAQMNTEGDIPFIFGLLTDNTKQQSLDRSGGKYGNKGEGCAIAAIKIADLAWKYK